jgi:ABC-2 type transport system permease protein
MLGTGIGNNAWFAVAWCVALTVVGYVWAKRLYNRDPSR